MNDRYQVAREKSSILEALYERMRREHVGARNAVVTKVLADWFDVQNRAIRIAMHEILLRKRCPVISFEGTETKEGYQGWFVAANEEEKDLYVQTLRKKIKPLQRRMLMIGIVYEQYYKTQNNKE